jgi:bifunctional DNA-binding transcriptional regulator/antitoxin component of YhaV-PrlF toxin-antitoxin module
MHGERICLKITAETKKMSSTEVLTITENGDLTLPAHVIERYHIQKEMQFRIIPTQKGVLLVPLTDQPMNGELKSEIGEWQAIGAEGWDKFEYEENTE